MPYIYNTIRDFFARRYTPAGWITVNNDKNSNNRIRSHHGDVAHSAYSNAIEDTINITLMIAR